MPQLPFVCLHCHRVFKRVEVSRPVRLGETASGLCPEHTEKMEAGLYGPFVGRFERRYCGCGRQLVTVNQLVTGICEHCSTEQALNPNGIEESDAEIVHRATVAP